MFAFRKKNFRKKVKYVYKKREFKYVIFKPQGLKRKMY